MLLLLLRQSRRCNYKFEKIQRNGRKVCKFLLVLHAARDRRAKTKFPFFTSDANFPLIRFAKV